MIAVVPPASFDVDACYPDSEGVNILFLLDEEGYLVHPEDAVGEADDYDAVINCLDRLCDYRLIYRKMEGEYLVYHVPAAMITEVASRLNRIARRTHVFG